MARSSGFTLSELLIALGILGVIATFTIPKILSAQSSAQNIAVTKEAAAMVAGALQAYQVSGSVTTSTEMKDLTPYMNYVRVDTTTTIDSAEGLTTVSCGGSYGSVQFRCLELHSGARLLYTIGEAFGGTANTNALYFYLDPDGRSTGSTKSVVFFIYANGRLTTWGNVLDNTTVLISSNGMLDDYAAEPARDPTWFRW